MGGVNKIDTAARMQQAQSTYDTAAAADRAPKQRMAKIDKGMKIYFAVLASVAAALAISLAVAQFGYGKLSLLTNKTFQIAAGATIGGLVLIPGGVWAGLRIQMHRKVNADRQAAKEWFEDGVAQAEGRRLARDMGSPDGRIASRARGASAVDVSETYD